MYKVVIAETKMVKTMVGKEWDILSETDKTKERGYTPEIEKEVEVEQVIYTQLVEELDLAVVIQAINDML